MAAIRRTLSPLPRPIPNGEACLVASPLSRSSLSPHNYQTPINPPPPSFSSFEYGFYQARGFIIGLFSKRSSRPLERQKPKGQVRKRSILHFFVCFVVGVFYGITPLVSINSPLNIISKHQAFPFKVVQPPPKNVTPLLGTSYTNANSELVINDTKSRIQNGTFINSHVNQPLNEELDIEVRKLLIIVTPTNDRPFQAHHLNRLAHTIKLIPPPLLWIVVDMGAQSVETAKFLRGNGVMYRHLVCDKNLSDVRDRSVHQRNVALSHIETHKLDGIVYFANDDNIYSVDIFEPMRKIRSFGTWVVANLADSTNRAILKGPICNGTQVIGWHTNGATRRSQRFYAELPGFAFNSTILWDHNTWHKKPSLKAIRQLDTVSENQVSTFVEQFVEDESQMECLPMDLSKIMVWHLHVESMFSYPPEWLSKNKNLDVSIPHSTKL